MTAATKHTPRSIARRRQHLNDQIKALEKLLEELTGQLVPQPAAAFGADAAAEILVVAGDTINRIRSEPARAPLCGVAPIPASSRMTNRHRLHRGRHPQANAALYRAVIVGTQHHQPTRADIARRTTKATPRPRPIHCRPPKSGRFHGRSDWLPQRPKRIA